MCRLDPHIYTHPPTNPTNQPTAAWHAGALTVGDLKARVAALTGIRPEKQKLLFKGLLGNGAVALCKTQLRDGSKVVVMGGGGGGK